jgi:hypothetical protein
MASAGSSDIDSVQKWQASMEAIRSTFKRTNNQRDSRTNKLVLN